MSTNNGNFREYKLSNGLAVALQETPTQTVSGRLRVWHGALNEKQGEEGIAHFLEHNIMTGGSEKYSPKKADEVMAFFGGGINAFTSLDRTIFPIDMFGEDMHIYLEFISDVVFNPRFDLTRLEEERQRVLRELADAKSNPSYKDRRKYSEAFFGKDSPHIYSVLGNESVIESATAKNLKEFHERGYNPNNMSLIFSGDLPKNIEELIEKNFGACKSQGGKKFEFPRNPKLVGNTIIHTCAPDLLNYDNLNQSSSQLGISLYGPNDADEDSYAVGLLVKILGEGSNSRLFTSVSQRKGLAYSIDAEYGHYNNIGGIYVGGNIHALRAEEAIDAIFEEMNILKRELVPQDILGRLKRHYTFKVAKNYETNEGHVHGIELKLDEGLTSEYILMKLNEVTPEKIREAAIKYFPENRERGDYVLLLRDPLKK